MTNGSSNNKYRRQSNQSNNKIHKYDEKETLKKQFVTYLDRTNE